MLNTLKLIFLAVLIALGFGVYYYYEQSEHYCELWKNANANNIYLIKQRKKDYGKTIQIAERNRELEAEAKNDKSSFDWNYDISNSPVILRLREN